MIDSPSDLADVLDSFIRRNGRSERRLADMTEATMKGHFRVAHKTINNWRHGISKPREWQFLLSLAMAMELSKSEANNLLQAAGHPPIDQLRTVSTDEWELSLLAHWNDVENAANAKAYSPPFQAPRNIPNFVGRQQELAWLKKEALNQHGPRLCCLSGIGGVGKTSLAIQFAHLMRPFFPDGVLWIQLNQTDLMSALLLMARAYGEDVSPYPDMASRASRVRSIMQDKRALLVLDDVGLENEIGPLLPPAGPAFVLVTSRLDTVAELYGGLHRSIDSFALDSTDPSNNESLLLFAEILSAQRVREHMDEFLTIARLLGELPLAISLAAHWLRKRPYMSPHTLLERLSDTSPFDLLHEPHRSLQLTFNLSFQTLLTEQQRFFVMLGVFTGEFDAAAAAYIVSNDIHVAEDYLVYLSTISLVQSLGNGRYQLHSLLREFSQKQPQDPLWLARMSAYFINLIVQHEGADFPDNETNNILAALDVALALPLPNELVKGVRAAYRYLRRQGHYARLQQYLERVVEIAQELEDHEQTCEALLYWGHVTQRLGNSLAASEHYQEAYRLAQQLEDEEAMCAALLALGAHQHRQGQLSEAGWQYKAALTLTSPTDSDQRIALLTNLGLLAADQGEFEQAEDCYQEALGLARKQTGRQRRLINLLHNYGDFLSIRGHTEKAKQYIKKGVELARETADAELLSRLLGNWGLLHLREGDLETAADLFEEGLTIANNANHIQQIGRQLTNLGRWAAETGQHQEATKYFEDALVKARQIGASGDIASILVDWGEVALLQSDLKRAKSLFQEAQQIAANHHYVYLLAESLFGQAQVKLYANDRPAARALAIESLSTFQKMGHIRANAVKAWLAENKLQAEA